MRKRDELVNGCMAKARDDEMTFVLLGRDSSAPFAIRAWISHRIMTGKNKPDDPQLVEAEECANTIERELCGCRHCTPRSTTGAAPVTPSSGMSPVKGQ